MEFFSSELGVAIAWVCSVLGFIFGFIKKREASYLKLKIRKITNENIKIKNEIKVLKEESSDNSKNDITQNGEKNIYNKQVTGGMKIEM